MPTVILSPGETFGPAAGTIQFFGSEAAETLLLGDGAYTLDPSFARGGDIVELSGSSETWTVRRSGSSAILTSADAEITIPIGSRGATIRFDDGEATLRYDTGSGRFLLDELALSGQAQTVSLGPVDYVPVIVLAGQSNAALPGMDHQIFEVMRADNGAFEFVKVAAGRTSLFPDGERPSWDPSGGVLFRALVEQTREAIANVIAQGQRPLVNLLWVQGENDQDMPSAAYAAQLTAFIAAFRLAIGAPEAGVTLSLLQDGRVRAAQLDVAATVDGVGIVETIGADMLDALHYTPEAAARIAQAFLDRVQPNPPQLASYDNLLVETAIDVRPGMTRVVVAEFGQLVFHETSSRYEISGGAGADDFRTGAANDVILAQGGDDVVDAGGGDDIVQGGHGDDLLIGGAGNDVLNGYTNDDRLIGGSGDDVLHGGISVGADILVGGSGADRFVFGNLLESNLAATDIIRDFNLAEGDRIDLSALDIQPLTAVRDAFRFVGTLPFSGMARELRVQSDNAATWLFGDADGDMLADFAVRLDGVVAITAEHILL